MNAQVFFHKTIVQDNPITQVVLTNDTQKYDAKIIICKIYTPQKFVNISCMLYDME